MVAGRSRPKWVLLDNPLLHSHRIRPILYGQKADRSKRLTTWSNVPRRFIEHVYRQGTGKTKDGIFITIDHLRTAQEGKGYLKIGHGRASLIPWKSVASKDPRLPRGQTYIVIQRYEDRGALKVEDEGGELRPANHVDVFVGEMFKREADDLDGFWSRVGIVR
jgi:hypothetical protein